VWGRVFDPAEVRKQDRTMVEPLLELIWDAVLEGVARVMAAALLSLRNTARRVATLLQRGRGS